MKQAAPLMLVLSIVAGCADTTATPVKIESDVSVTTETPTVPEKVERTDEQWREQLTPEQFHVLREKGTESPYTNEFDEHFAAGTYACAACGQELFESETKFNSGCGWPAFYAAKAGDRVTLTSDRTIGIRTEVTCSRCDISATSSTTPLPRQPVSATASIPFR